MEELANLSLEDIDNARRFIMSSGRCWPTPLLSGAEKCLPGSISKNCRLYLKLENMQNTGCFKIRGAAFQIHKALSGVEPDQKLLTFSGGNYGKAFATVLSGFGRESLVLMPDVVSEDRVSLIQGLGSRVELHPAKTLPGKVDEYAKIKNTMLIHPFDDLNLIAGYGSLGLEILEEVPDPDFVLVPCGGGGLLSGIAASLRLRGLRATKIIGVEPETADCMHRSFEIGAPATVLESRSLAGGLAAPEAGRITFEFCRRFVDEMVLVSEEDIRKALGVLVRLKLIVEPSGAVGLAALMAGKIEGALDGKKIVIVISGGNVTLDNLSNLTEH